MDSHAAVIVRYGQLLLLICRLSHGLTQAAILSTQTAHYGFLVLLVSLMQICVLLVVQKTFFTGLHAALARTHGSAILNLLLVRLLRSNLERVVNMLFIHDSAVVRRQWPYLAAREARIDRLTRRYILIAMTRSRLSIAGPSALRGRIGTAQHFQGARS